MSRVLVCGGRDYTNFEQVDRVLSLLAKVEPIEVIIQGGATGADDLARAYAEEKGIPTITEEADWVTHGDAAGPIRNTAMIKKHKPTIIIAFPGGKGTANMVKQGKMHKIKVIEVRDNR